jgi:hypothetical protein
MAFSARSMRSSFDSRRFGFRVSKVSPRCGSPRCCQSATQLSTEFIETTHHPSILRARTHALLMMSINRVPAVLVLGKSLVSAEARTDALTPDTIIARRFGALWPRTGKSSAGRRWQAGPRRRLLSHYRLRTYSLHILDWDSPLRSCPDYRPRLCPGE